MRPCVVSCTFCELEVSGLTGHAATALGLLQRVWYPVVRLPSAWQARSTWRVDAVDMGGIAARMHVGNQQAAQPPAVQTPPSRPQPTCYSAMRAASLATRPPTRTRAAEAGSHCAVSTSCGRAGVSLSRKCCCCLACGRAPREGAPGEAGWGLRARKRSTHVPRRRLCAAGAPLRGGHAPPAALLGWAGGALWLTVWRCCAVYLRGQGGTVSATRPCFRPPCGSTGAPP
jgi:hypothetical protein